MNLRTAAANLVADLVADGVPAVADVRDLQLPGVLVLLRSVTPQDLAGTWSLITWDILVITRAAGTPHALDELSDLLTALTASGLTEGPFEARTFSDPALGGELPALITTITTEQEN